MALLAFSLETFFHEKVYLARLAWLPWPPLERGQPAVRSSSMLFRNLSWWPPLFFTTQNGDKKKITEYRDAQALRMKATLHTRKSF